MGLRRRPARPLELDSEGEEGDETSGKEEESSSEKEEEQEEEGGLVKPAAGKVRWFVIAVLDAVIKRGSRNSRCQSYLLQKLSASIRVCPKRTSVRLFPLQVL